MRCRTRFGWRSLLCTGLALLLGAGEARAQRADGTPTPSPARARPDSNVFVVLPFRVSGPPEMQYLRESMVDLLHMALDGVGRTRVVYPPAALRRLSALTDASDATSAARVARDLGAGRMVGGAIVVTGS